MPKTYADMTPDAVKTLITECGGELACCTLLGVTRKTIYNWTLGGIRIPQRHVDALHAHLRGECPCCKRPL